MYGQGSRWNVPGPFPVPKHRSSHQPSQNSERDGCKTSAAARGFFRWRGAVERAAILT